MGAINILRGSLACYRCERIIDGQRVRLGQDIDLQDRSAECYECMNDEQPSFNATDSSLDALLALAGNIPETNILFPVVEDDEDEFEDDDEDDDEDNIIRIHTHLIEGDSCDTLCDDGLITIRQMNRARRSVRQRVRRAANAWYR